MSWLLLALAFATGQRDPHEQMRDAPESESACVLCHNGAPTAEAPALHLPAESLCQSCHLGEDHSGVASHLGRKPPQASVDRATAAGLPLPNGTIACVSCHDPHPREAADPDAVVPARWWTAVLGERGTAPAEPDLLRRGLHDGALCTACHDPAAPRLAP